MGFFRTYFNGDIDDLENFAKRFINRDPRNVLTMWQAEYEDINTAMAEVLKVHWSSISLNACGKTYQRDIAFIKRMMQKHHITKVQHEEGSEWVVV